MTIEEAINRVPKSMLEAFNAGMAVGKESVWLFLESKGFKRKESESGFEMVCRLDKATGEKVKIRDSQVKFRFKGVPKC